MIAFPSMLFSIQKYTGRPAADIIVLDVADTQQGKTQEFIFLPDLSCLSFLSKMNADVKSSFRNYANFDIQFRFLLSDIFLLIPGIEFPVSSSSNAGWSVSASTGRPLRFLRSRILVSDAWFLVDMPADHCQCFHRFHNIPIYLLNLIGNVVNLSCELRHPEELATKDLLEI
ncbi:MAG: hypothetical protein GY866_42325 [Proteobacteria bacterium]|nr:hypothetical protein [Pseudomonadota bacterium]